MISYLQPVEAKPRCTLKCRETVAKQPPSHLIPSTIFFYAPLPFLSFPSFRSLLLVGSWTLNSLVEFQNACNPIAFPSVVPEPEPEPEK
ncbi:unnamed protein product [Periconia digitata]|uniref:Uncharacterized protein n=1 Tax=Periconia digitata TaxID=1303443 RepID=A0A9W4XWV8_9PLEO|nr:unnamed protein product [Periconia digitata]